MASKKELAQELYNRMAAAGTVSRQEFIKQAQLDPLNMTPAGASTYYVNCKKIAEGGEVKTYKPSSTAKAASHKVDDSKENADLWSIVVVENLKVKGAKAEGKVEATHSFMSAEQAVARYHKLNATNKERCVVVAGSPSAGTDVSKLQLIPTS